MNRVQLDHWRYWARKFSIAYLRTLLALSVFIVAMSSTYLAMHHTRVFPKPDQIVVYGRDSCGITAAFRRELDEQHIPYIYADIDKPLLDEEMWYKVDLPPGKHKVTLPVVQVAGRVLESPDATYVLSLRTAIAQTH